MNPGQFAVPPTRAESDVVMMKWRRTLRRRNRRHHRNCVPGCPFAPWAKTKLYREPA